MILTSKDIMKRYQISRSSVNNLVKKGALPKGFYLGRIHRWTLEELENFEKEQVSA